MHHTPNHASCPECDESVEADPKHGEQVCSDCGVVVEERAIDRGPEWTAYSARERREKSRVGRPTTTTMHDKGLSTRIGWKDQDGYGEPLSVTKRRQMQRLRTWDDRCRVSGKERSLRQALGEINRMASALGVPPAVRETASVIFRRALTEDLILGRSIEGMATGAVYAAARQEGIPRSLDEVGTVSRVDKLRFARAYRRLSDELGLEMKPQDPMQYIPRFASELDLPHHAQRLAHDILSVVIDTPYMSGNSPVSLAAAAIYASAKLLENQLSPEQQLTQREVSDVSGVTSVTIRTHYPELIDRHQETGNGVSEDG